MHTQAKALPALRPLPFGEIFSAEEPASAVKVKLNIRFPKDFFSHHWIAFEKLIKPRDPIRKEFLGNSGTIPRMYEHQEKLCPEVELPIWQNILSESKM